MYIYAFKNKMLHVLPTLLKITGFVNACYSENFEHNIYLRIFT